MQPQLAALLEQIKGEGYRIQRRPLARLLGVQPATVDRMVTEGRLPPPLRLSARKLFFDTELVCQALSRLTPEDDAS